MNTKDQITALQNERNNAFHAWIASKNESDWKHVRQLDSYIDQLKANKDI